MVRIRSKWTNKKKERSLEETAGALAFIEWRIAQQALLNLENEGFQTDTQSDRLDVLQELSSFLIHVADRIIHKDFNDEERQRFVVALAKKSADFLSRQLRRCKRTWNRTIENPLLIP